MKQARLHTGWRCPTLGQRVRLACFVFLLQVIKDLLDHQRAFNTGNDFHGAASLSACFNIDVEDAFQSQPPGHGRAAFGGRLVLRLIEGLGLGAFTTLGGRHQGTIFTVGSKHPVPTGEVDSRLRHQRRQFYNEVRPRLLQQFETVGGLPSDRHLARENRALPALHR